MKLRTKILLIALLPVLLLGAGMFILAADRTANGIYDQAYAGMQAAALAVRDIFEIGNEGAYQVDENGDLWKGSSLNISQSNGIVDHIKDNTGMDVTIFWGDTRILTSIKNKDGQRQTQSAAPEDVARQVLKNGEYYISRDVEILGTHYVACYVPFYQEGTNEPVGMVFLGTPQADVSAIIREIRMQMLTAIVIVLILAGLFLTKLVNSMVNALESGMGLLQRISKGDLTAKADAALLRRTDEIGLIGKEITELQNWLLSMIDLLRTKSFQLDEDADILKKRSENILHVMKALEQSAQEMAGSCANQADYAGTASCGVSAMGEMIGASHVQIQRMDEISSQIQEVSVQTTAELTELNTAMKTVRQSIDYLAQQTSLTKDSVDKISSATDLIAAIASQTSLLSLNASIESARAGQFGKGFSVVADEIQKLSVQSDKAVEEIRTMVENLTKNSSQAMQRMEEVQEVIVQQGQNIQKTGNIFEQVKTGIQESTERMHNVKETADELEDVRTDMVAAVQSSAASAQENAASIQEIMASVENVYNELQIITENTKGLGTLSSEMKESISIFKVAESF